MSCLRVAIERTHYNDAEQSLQAAATCAGARLTVAR